MKDKFIYRDQAHELLVSEWPSIYGEDVVRHATRAESIVFRAKEIMSEVLYAVGADSPDEINKSYDIENQ